MGLGEISATIILIVSFLMISSSLLNQITDSALGQMTKANDTFSVNGAISSLVLGLPVNITTVDMNNVQKFILSGDWKMSVDKGNLTDFTASFYTGPVDGGIGNHTHQLYDFRVNNNKNGSYTPIQISQDMSVSISGILDVGTNGNSAWKDVNSTVNVLKGRTLSIDLADEDTERHFMGQQIYGIHQIFFLKFSYMLDFIGMQLSGWPIAPVQHFIQ
jgi:hypothetical protein